MKLNLLIIFLSAFALSVSAQESLTKNSKSDYFIIPMPQHLEAVDGRFAINSETVIATAAIAKNEANYLAEMLSVASGFNIPINISEDQGNIVLKIDSTLEQIEGYKLTVRTNHIELAAKTTKGIFYGIQTLRQLLPPSSEASVIAALSIPAVDIIDNPRFSYRGMHLDVGRHFFPVEFIKTYIDLIAMHKMNTFHWHLTDDQGWRIEIKQYPKLTEVGAWREETLIGHMSGPKRKLKYDGKKHGGFYTQEEIKDIVAYAQAQHVEIIPEIELPGHSLAVLAAYPELGNFNKEYEVGTYWGVYSQIYAPTEETFTFLDGVLSEVAELFPSKYIHIGGDEALKSEWEKSKFAQDLIIKEGLKDEKELQSYFIKRISDMLESKGKYIIGWDEIIEGGLAPGASVMFWREWLGYDEIIEAAENGHDIIMTPTSYCYFDYYQVPKKEIKKEPLAIGGYLSVQKVYEFEPMPADISPKAMKHIIGAQGNVWTEYMSTSEYVEYMALPRMTALAEVLWSGKETRNWEDFRKRLKKIAKRYDAMNVNYAKHSLK